MQTKIFNVDNKAVIAVKLEAETVDEAYLCGTLGMERKGKVALVRINAKSLPYSSPSHELEVDLSDHWRDTRMRSVHQHITTHFDDLESGETLDADDIEASYKAREEAASVVAELAAS